MKSLASHAPIALVAGAGAFFVAAIVAQIFTGPYDWRLFFVLVAIALLWVIAFVVVALKSGEIKLTEAELQKREVAAESLRRIRSPHFCRPAVC